MVCRDRFYWKAKNKKNILIQNVLTVWGVVKNMFF